MEELSVKYKGLFAFFVVLVLSISAFAVAPNLGGGGGLDFTMPRFDEIYYRSIPSTETAILALLSGELDYMPATGPWSNKKRVEDVGFNTSITEMAQFGYFGINCRWYINDTYTPGEGWTRAPASRSLSPLNYSCWRTAMHYMLGFEGKSALLSEIYGPSAKPLDSVVPYAQAYYHNPDVYVPKSGDTAWEVLTEGIPECCEGGFYVSGGVLYDPTGNEVRPDGAIEIWYSTGDENLKRFTEGLVATFNTCFADYGVTRANTPGYLDYPFKPVAMAFNQIVATILGSPWPDFDMVHLEWTKLGRFVDWTYDMFHGINIGAYNYVGFQDDECDSLTETIMFSLDLEEIKEAAFTLQEKFAYCWNPYVITDTGYQVSAYGHYVSGVGVEPLENWHAMFGYGSDQDWTWNSLHWMDNPTGECESLTRRIAQPPDEIDPFFSDSVYEWNILDRVIEGLLTINPYTLEDVPNVAHNWLVESWVNESEGVTAGMKLTYYLRDDVYWQDGWPVTSADCCFNWEMLQRHQIPRYRSMWQNLVRTEEPDAFTAVAYLNETSMYQLYNYAETALFYPRYVLEIADEYVQNGTWASIREFRPWTRDYRDFTGEEPLWSEPEKMELPGGEFTCLIGTHTYIFDYWSAGTNIGHVVKNPHYWKTAPVMYAVHLEETQYTVKVVNYGFKDTDDDWEDEIEQVLVEIRVTEDGTPDKHVEYYNLGFAEWHTWTYEYDPIEIEVGVGYARAGDFDFDGDMDQHDLSYLDKAYRDYYNPPFVKDPKCDFDNDCDIDQFDIWGFYAHWYDFFDGMVVCGDVDLDFDVDQHDFWYFCGAYIDYYRIGVKDTICDFDFDCDIDQHDLWTFCSCFIDYYA